MQKGKEMEEQHYWQYSVKTDVDSNLDPGGGDGETEAEADTYANAKGVSHGGSLSCCCLFS
jgi:hypothetical protein